jgi:hypothetical protein
MWLYIYIYSFSSVPPGTEIGTSSIDWAQLSKLLPEDGDRVQSSKGCFKIKNRAIDNVQKVNNFNNSWLLLVGAPNKNPVTKLKNWHYNLTCAQNCFLQQVVTLALVSISCCVFFCFFLFGLWDYRHCGHSWPIVPASGDNEDDCGEHDGM